MNPLVSHRKITLWGLGAWAIGLLVLSPIIALTLSAVGGSFSHWVALFKETLQYTAVNTAVLLAGVGLCVGLIGTGCAWLTTAYDFPSRKVLMWALLLPLAIPTYIMAFAYLDVMHPIGPVQTLLRELLGYASPRDFRLPDIRSMPGAIGLMSLALYPYVYLSVRIMFMSQSANLVEAARILGCTPAQAFRRLILPMARPAIAIGISLALLETLNDIGASEFLGVKTLTVSIYTEWVSRSNLASASQIAMFMLLVVSLLIYVEMLSRQRQRYANTQRLRPIQPRRLRGLSACVAILLGWLPVIVGFFVPATYLINEAYRLLHYDASVLLSLAKPAQNTIVLALLATAVTVLAGLLVAWVVRNPHFRHGKFLTRCASLGYAIPGSVLAIGLLTPFMLGDNVLSWLGETLFNARPQLYIMGSIAGLVIAYAIRFLAIAIGSVESGFARIPLSLDNAAQTLGHSREQTFYRIHLPLLRPALGAAALLIFVDAMKELSATLLLRPLNFETLSTLLYAEAARGTYEEGALAALLIVIVGLVPVIFLAKTQFKTAL